MSADVPHNSVVLFKIKKKEDIVIPVHDHKWFSVLVKSNVDQLILLIFEEESKNIGLRVRKHGF